MPPRLASKLNETLGSDAAGDLVTWLDELRREHAEQREASRADFAELRQELLAMEARISERVSTQMHALETNLRGEIHAVENRLGDRINSVETDLGRRIGDVGKEVEKSAAYLIRWSFVFWVGAVAAIAILAGVLRQ